MSRRGLIAVVFDAPGSMEDRIPGGLRGHTALIIGDFKFRPVFTQFTGTGALREIDDSG